MEAPEHRQNPPPGQAARASRTTVSIPPWLQLLSRTSPSSSSRATVCSWAKSSGTGPSGPVRYMRSAGRAVPAPASCAAGARARGEPPPPPLRAEPTSTGGEHRLRDTDLPVRPARNTVQAASERLRPAADGGLRVSLAEDGQPSGVVIVSMGEQGQPGRGRGRCRAGPRFAQTRRSAPRRADSTPPGTPARGTGRAPPAARAGRSSPPGRDAKLWIPGHQTCSSRKERPLRVGTALKRVWKFSCPAAPWRPQWPSAGLRAGSPHSGRSGR